MKQDQRPLILAIDDTPANLFVLAKALSDRYSFQLASSGEEGLRIAAMHHPDLILLDVMMPVMDGFETCRRLKADNALAGIPVIFITALSDVGSEVSGLQLGASDYLHKPISVDIAAQRIGNLIEREQLRLELQMHRDHLEEEVAKRTSELVEARAEAEKASRAKSAFLANMSHEIRTPMNAIIGLTHMLRRNNPRPDQSERLGNIVGAAEHLLSVINDILDMSKIEAGRLELERTEFDPEYVILNICNILQEKIGSKAIELIADLHALPATLYGDGQRLGQVLLNFMSNAVKFTDEGSITVRAWVVAVSDEGLTIRFEVIDTGIGLSPEQRSMLFKPFVQADASTSRKYGGTGLGLAISRRMIEMMGGQIGVESTPGQGSTFWIEVPFGFGGMIVRERAESIETVGLRALLAEAQPETREALRDMLEMLGMEVKVADTGAAAVECVQKAETAGAQFDLLLIDAHLPDIDGLTLGMQLSMLPLARPPVRLLLTVYGEDPSQDSLGAAGYFDYLLKPLAPSTLYDPIQDALSGNHRPARDLLPSDVEADLQHRGGARVLLVEDNLINQEVAIDLLRSVGIHPDIADNGEIAVAKVREQEYELILMDMDMPVLDGLSATRLIRAMPGRQDVPILAMTANAFDESREACRAVGMNDHIVKPVDPELLYKALMRWLPAHLQSEVAGAAPAMTPKPVVSIPSRKTEQSADFEIPRLNTAAGLHCVGGKLDLYKRLLLQFAENGNAALLLRSIAEKDIPTAHRAAHTLKGLAGTMGALTLQAHATVLDNQIRGPHPVDPAYDLVAAASAIEKEFSELALAIRTVLQQNAPQGRGAAIVDPDWQIDPQILHKLEELLACSEMSSASFYREHQAEFDRHLGKEVRAFSRQLDAYSLDEALLILQRASSKT